MRIAIIGSGVSGLVTAYLLHTDHDVHIFEADSRIGGHVHTHDIRSAAGNALKIDTGFIVFNDWTYPNFIRLLDRLGVPSQASDMSFSVRCESTGLEYSGGSLDGLFAQRRNLASPRFYRMLWEIARFYREAPALIRPRMRDDTITIGQYLQQRGYSRIFIDKHLRPMIGAIWSAHDGACDTFPAAMLVQFFQNHGMMRLLGRPVWRVIKGGSSAYVDRLISSFRDRIRLNTPVERIQRGETYVDVTPAGGTSERFDQVVLATHSDQALAILGDDATPAERAVLSAIAYQPNETVLHTDTRQLPRSRRAWASWNYVAPQNPAPAATVTYNMNMLQRLTDPETYCVTLNRTAEIDQRRRLATMLYHHPIYSVEAVQAQRRWAEISGVRRTHFAGAYWGNGFHEDGVNSALAVAGAFGRRL